MIRQWIGFIRAPGCAGIASSSSSDYDMLLTEQLVQGVDVWINTPRRPWEACGTSGMKVLVNGGLNLSELDGWWAEAYAPEVGWAHRRRAGPRGRTGLGRGAKPRPVRSAGARDGCRPFYRRDAQGLPADGWRGCARAWRS